MDFCKTSALIPHQTQIYHLTLTGFLSEKPAVVRLLHIFHTKSHFCWTVNELSVGNRSLGKRTLTCLPFYFMHSPCLLLERETDNHILIPMPPNKKYLRNGNFSSPINPNILSIIFEKWELFATIEPNYFGQPLSKHLLTGN